MYIYFHFDLKTVIIHVMNVMEVLLSAHNA